MDDRFIKLALDSGLLNYVDHETPRHYFINGHANLEDVAKFAKLVILETCQEAVDEIERLREERHGLREVLQFYAEFTKSTSRYRDMVHYLSDGGKLAALALKDGE